MNARHRMALAALTLPGATGCGVDTQGEPVLVEDAEVPFGLVEASPESVPSTTVTGTAVAIYLVLDDSLFRTVRTVSDDDPNTVLEQLLAQPTATETELGLRSALSDDDVRYVDAVQVDRGVATVDLSAFFADLDSANQILAIAQLVYTLTAQPGTGQVTFTIDGSPTDVPRSDGTITRDPLTRSDYPDLLDRR